MQSAAQLRIALCRVGLCVSVWAAELIATLFVSPLSLHVPLVSQVSMSAWLVTGMVGFVVVTIGYTQWEYTNTTARVETDARTRKTAAREARKELIRRELDAEEGPIR